MWFHESYDFMMRTQWYFCTVLCQNMALKIQEPRHFFSFFSFKLAQRYNTNSHKTKIVIQAQNRRHFG